MKVEELAKNIIDAIVAEVSVINVCAECNKVADVEIGVDELSMLTEHLAKTLKREFESFKEAEEIDEMPSDAFPTQTDGVKL